jgi:hypothetical protein
MARGRTTSAASRLVRLEERLAEARRACVGDQGPVVVYADDDASAVERHVEERERHGGLVVVIRSLAQRPEGTLPPWS